MRTILNLLVVGLLINLSAHLARAGVSVTGVVIEYSHGYASPNYLPSFPTYSYGDDGIELTEDVENSAVHPVDALRNTRSVASFSISTINQVIMLRQFVKANGLSTLGYVMSVYFNTDSELTTMYGYEPIQQYSGNPPSAGGIVMGLEVAQRVGPNGYQLLSRHLGPVADGRSFDYFTLAPNSSFKVTLVASGTQAVGNPYITGGNSAGALLSFDSLPTEEDWTKFQGVMGETSTPKPELAAVHIQASTNNQPPSFSGIVTRGYPQGTARLQASLDLGATDPWTDVATATMDAEGSATFNNISDSRSQALGARSHYFRVVTEPPLTP